MVFSLVIKELGRVLCKPIATSDRMSRIAGPILFHYVWLVSSLGTHHSLTRIRVKLSADLALIMNYETGISIRWLLNGNTKAPPVSADGRKYTKAIFDELQATSISSAQVKATVLKIDALEFLRRIVNILLTANRKELYHLAAYRIGKALNEWTAQLGEPTGFNNYEKLLTYLLPVWQSKVPGLRKRDHPTAPKPKSKRPLKKNRGRQRVFGGRRGR